MNEAIAALEELRLEIKERRRHLGSMQDYLDRKQPRPSPEERADAELWMEEEQRRVAERTELYRQQLQALRHSDPDAVRSWVQQHLAVLDAILAEPAPPDLPLSESLLPVRRFVAERTAAEWWEVLTGTRDYVQINQPYLPDYETRLQALEPER
ncbi:MAG: hypothetical protein ACLFU8_17055 [Anaerolineales bacterium]